jgi:hypothetical protein
MIWCLDVGIFILQLELLAILAVFLGLIFTLYFSLHSHGCPLCQGLGCQLASGLLRWTLIYAFCIQDNRFTAFLELGRLYPSEASAERAGFEDEDTLSYRSATGMSDSLEKG